MGVLHVRIHTTVVRGYSTTFGSTYMYSSANMYIYM